MLNGLSKRWLGISLIEILLALMVVCSGMMLGFKQYFQYVRNKDITLIQQTVNQLLQAGSAYYYATCSSIEAGQVSLQTLQGLGLLPNLNALYNPWGKPFAVWIINNDNVGSNSSSYLIQIKADFSERTLAQIKQMAVLLKADSWTGGTELSWTGLPGQVLKYLPLSVRSPGGWVPSISGTYNGGQSLSSNLEVMKGDLAKFSKDEARNANGFTCPN